MRKTRGFLRVVPEKKEVSNGIKKVRVKNALNSLAFFYLDKPCTQVKSMPPTPLLIK